MQGQDPWCEHHQLGPATAPRSDLSGLLSSWLPVAAISLTLHFRYYFKKANELICALRIYQAPSKICFVFTAVLPHFDDAISREIDWCNAGNSTIVILLKRRVLWSQWKRKVKLSSAGSDPINCNNLNLWAGLGVKITTSCWIQMTSSCHPQILGVWQPRRWHTLEGRQLQWSWQVLWIWEETFS